MLPTQEHAAIPTYVLSTQNSRQQNLNSPQIYSLLSTPKPSPTIGKSRRAKMKKSDGFIPVMINPQITRTLTGITIEPPTHRSTTLSQYLPTVPSAHSICDRTQSGSFSAEYNSCDTNNNINRDQISSLYLSSDSLIPIQIQQRPTISNESVSNIHTLDPTTQISSEPFVLQSSQLLNNIAENILSSNNSIQQESFTEYNQQIQLKRKKSKSDISVRATPLPFSPMLSGNSRPAKPKKKYSRKGSVSYASTEQPLKNQCSATFMEPTVFYGLPSMIPTSLTLPPTHTDEVPSSMDNSLPQNFIPETLSTSISSAKSPINVSNENSLLNSRKHLIMLPMNNAVDLISTSRQYCQGKEYFGMNKITNNSCNNAVSYDIGRLIATIAAAASFTASAADNTATISSSSIAPTINQLHSASQDSTSLSTPSTKSSSTLPEVISVIPSVIPLPDTAEVDKCCKICDCETRTVQESTEKLSSTLKKGTTSLPNSKAIKCKRLNKNDIRARRKLRRIAHRHRLAMLKFIMRKRKRQRQERTTSDKLAEIQDERIDSALTNTNVLDSNENKSCLPDIVAHSLKVSFDATRNIDSITLYYHHRRKPDTAEKASSNSFTSNDNNLSLLLEAVELMEALHGNSKLALSSDKSITE